MSERGGEGVSAAERRRRLAGGIASAVLVAVAVALALVGGGGDDRAGAFDSSPHFVAVSDLVDLEASAGHPIYWAGPRAGTRLELTAEVDGNVYLRYLPAGTPAGDPGVAFLTVGTYPVPSAAEALRRTAAKSNSSLTQIPDGGFVLVNPASRGSVYLAYPESDLEIEVYDPAQGKALRLIRSGAIRPVGE